MPTEAIIYIRKSIVKSGAPDPASPAVQKEAGEAKAAELRATPILFSDVQGHNSGKSDKRVAYQAALRYARENANRVKYFIVYRYNRAVRNVKLLLELVDTLAQLNIKLVSCLDNIDVTSAQGRMMLTMLAAADEYQPNENSEQRKATIDEIRRKRGRHYGGIPFGCLRIRQDNDIMLVPSASLQPNGTDHDALVRLYEIYATDRLSFRKTADALNTEGWRFRDRQKKLRLFDSNDVRRAICNHWTYAGLLTIGNSSKVKVEVIKAKHSPILSSKLTRAAAARWAKASQNKKGRGGHRRAPAVYPLTGILYCACGNKLTGSGRTHHNDSLRYYGHRVRCPNDYQGSISSRKADDMVRKKLATLKFPRTDHKLTDEKALAILRREMIGDTDDTERARLTAGLERLKDLYITGDITRDEYNRRKTELTAQMPTPSTTPTTPLAALDLPSILDQITDCPPPVLRDLVSALYAKIIVKDGEIIEYIPREWCKGWAA